MAVSMANLNERLQNGEILLLDGGVSTEIRRRGVTLAISAASVSSESRRFRVVSLPLESWPELLPFLLQCIEAGLSTSAGTDGDAAAAASLDGDLLTLRKMLEDAPREFEEKSGPAFGSLIPLLLKTFQSPAEKVKKEGLIQRTTWPPSWKSRRSVPECLLPHRPVEAVSSLCRG